MVIRKISIGSDYKNSMNYVVGQKVISEQYSIHEIRQLAEGIEVWVISLENEIVKWKAFNSTMPVSIEYNINF